MQYAGPSWITNTAREEAKSIPFSSRPFKGHRCPLLAARHIQTPSYKATLVKAEQSVLSQEEFLKGKKKIMNSSEVISEAAE